MRYIAGVFREGSATIASFPDCPGCNTFVQEGEQRTIDESAREALESWLEAQLVAGRLPPLPSRKPRLPRGSRPLAVEISLSLGTKIVLRQARHAAGLSQRELATRLGVSPQQIAKLEHPDSNPTIETLEKVARALGARFELGLASGERG